MSIRLGILAGLSVIWIALLCAWLFAPSVFNGASNLLDTERLEVLVARAGLWGPVLIVALMTLRSWLARSRVRPSR